MKFIFRCERQEFSSDRMAKIFCKTLAKVEKQPKRFRIGVWFEKDLILDLFQEKPHSKMSTQVSLLVTKEVETMLKK